MTAPSAAPQPPILDVEAAVRARYSAASQAAEPALCCPVKYEAKYLAVLPSELIERDYGCGDPSRFVAEGEAVLDLGSGGGKICYIASQIVGPQGRVIGVDMNEQMLELARKYQAEIAGRVDLRLDDAGYGWTTQLVGRALAHPALKVVEAAVAFRRRAGGESKVSGRLGPSLRAGRAMLS